MTCDLCLICPQDISREGLQSILSSDGFNIVHSCRSLTDLVDANIDSDFLAVIDLNDPDSELQAIESLRAHYPDAKVTLLVEQFDMAKMVQCFDAGVNGYIVKSIRSEPLITALRLVALGEKVLPSELAEVLSKQQLEPHARNDFEDEVEHANLSSRERDVLCCLMAGHSNKVIARELDVCEATVKVHIKAILRKLEVRNRTQAALWASTRGFSNTYLVPQH